MTPWLPQPGAVLARILDQFWIYYRDHPTPAERARLDRRFTPTRDKKPELLLVLKHPGLLLHNNPAELGARQRVRKRDVSFGPRSPAGAAAWDTFITLATTARKLDLDFAAFLVDRFTRAG